MWLVSMPKYRQARHRQYMELTPPPPSKRPSRMGNGHLPNGHLIQNQYSDSGVESQVRVCHNYQLCVNSCSTVKFYYYCNPFIWTKKKHGLSIFLLRSTKLLPNKNFSDNFLEKSFYANLITNAKV